MATRSKKATQNKADPRPMSDIDQQQWIATAAYYKAATRGFTQGSELDDWLEAEREFNLNFKTN